MKQPIIGYHKDEKDDWVAELRCGHNQHVRHNPPWQLARIIHQEIYLRARQNENYA